MYRFKSHWHYHLFGIILIFCIPILLSSLTKKNINLPFSEVVAGTTTVTHKHLTFSVELESSVHIAQPFSYTLKILYNSDYVAPDFRRLLREVRISPFEQLYFSRPSITETVISRDSKEFMLSYPIFGINVVPHTEYELQPITLYYTDIISDENHSLTIQPESVGITGYYPQQFLDIPFQPIKGAVSDDTAQTKVLILVAVIFFVTIGGSFLISSVKPRYKLSDVEDVLEHCRAIKLHSQNTRPNVLAIERIFLQLLLRYRGNNAYQFWTNKLSNTDIVWKEYIETMKNHLRRGYSAEESDHPDLDLINNNLEKIVEHIENDITAERLKQLEIMRGSFYQRIKKHKMLFGGGIACMALTLLLITLLAKPSIWQNDEIIIYNSWIQRLPPRMFDENGDGGFRSLDVEMLSNIAEQMGVYEKLKSEVLKSKYLYNYGTILSKAYIATIMGSSNSEESGMAAMHMEEEEIADTPSFEFPVLLLATSARFYPYDEDTRRNLELAIMYRENEEKDDSGQQPGDIGPPLPGFSRDLEPVYF